MMSCLLKKRRIGSHKICLFHAKNVADVITIICDSLSNQLINMRMYMHESHSPLLISILHDYRYISFIISNSFVVYIVYLKHHLTRY